MLTVLELERTGVDNYVARRQVIHCKPNFWLVLDNTSGAGGSHTSTTWTSASDVHWQQGQTAGAFRLESPHANNYLDMFFLGSQNTQRSLVRGGLHPFAGWQLEHHAPTPAFALVVEQPTKNSWAATVWTLERSGAAARFDGPPQMKLWTDAAHWEMQLPGEAGGTALRREGNTLRLISTRGAEEALELTVPPDIGPAEAQLREQFMASASRYDLFSANLKRRKKVTYLLLGIFLLQSIFFAVYKRARGPFLDYLKYLTMIAWIAGGFWLVGFYL